LEEKEHVRTNFGPEEDEEAHCKLLQKRNNEKDVMKNDLLFQIKKK
jgi:hypothetical protein